MIAVPVAYLTFAWLKSTQASTPRCRMAACSRARRSARSRPRSTPAARRSADSIGASSIGVGAAAGAAPRLRAALRVEPLELDVRVIDVRHRRGDRAMPRLVADQLVHPLHHAAVRRM